MGKILEDFTKENNIKMEVSDSIYQDMEKCHGISPDKIDTMLVEMVKNTQKEEVTCLK